jgi:alpha-1,3-mannosyl-glycoprotein beta-1,2-N-acetylglucosaminyltransferase
MRLNSTSKGRDCVVPQVNRNFNIGASGSRRNCKYSVLTAIDTNIDLYNKYLRRMKVNENFINLGDLSYLLLNVSDLADYVRDIIDLLYNLDLPL